MEQVFFRLHVRFVRAFCNVFPAPARRVLEVISLLNAFFGLFLLIGLHQMFVGPNQFNNCLDVQFSSIYRTSGTHPYSEFDNISVYQLKLYDGPPESRASCVSRGGGGVEGNCPYTAFRRDSHDRVYTFSKEKGLLMLPKLVREARNITDIPIEVSTQECFGGSLGSWGMRNITNEDVAVLNWFLSSFGSQGHMYSSSSKEMYNLHYTPQSRALWKKMAIKDNPRDLGRKKDSSESAAVVHDEVLFMDKVFFKVGALATTAFVFFATSTLVSFTLRETQHRMLKFTYLLQDRIRRNEPYASLIFTHVIESLVFVPIMVGMHFFLSATFSDQLLGFEVFSLMWLSEVYSVMCVRAKLSIRFFPKFFWLYFMLFHLYVFSYPFGFSSIALLTTVLFIQHAMLYFWNRFEVPALETGTVSVVRPRSNWGNPAENEISTIGAGGRSPFRRSGRNRGRTQSLDNALSTSASAGTQRRVEGNSTRIREQSRGDSESDMEERRRNFEYMYDYYNRTASNDGEPLNGLVLNDEQFNASVELSRRIQLEEVAALVGEESEPSVGGHDGRVASATLSHRYGYRTNRVRVTAPTSTFPFIAMGSRSDGEPDVMAQPRDWQSSTRGQNGSLRRQPHSASPANAQSAESRARTPEHLSDRDFPLFGVDLDDDDESYFPSQK